MKIKILKFTILFYLLIFSNAILAWDSTGHRVIAQIAYAHLTDSAKNKVDQLTQLLDPNYPSLSRFLFASTWADQLKNDDVTAFNSWHFINYPFSNDNTRLRPPEYENVVWAMAQSQKVLQSPKSNNYEKAVFLRFLIHFVGDAHQPLHCAEFYSHEFPDGDGSGNLFPIQDNNVQNLHAYWDEGLGWFRMFGQRYPLSNRETQTLAQKIQQDYPINSFSNQAIDLNPVNWTQQSFSLAKNFAYNIAENAKPSVSYNTQGQKIVEQQIALAGYRLANLLNHIFD